jgi:hypothetical protein
VNGDRTKGEIRKSCGRYKPIWTIYIIVPMDEYNSGRSKSKILRG